MERNRYVVAISAIFLAGFVNRRVTGANSRAGAIKRRRAAIHNSANRFRRLDFCSASFSMLQPRASKFAPVTTGVGLIAKALASERFVAPRCPRGDRDLGVCNRKQRTQAALPLRPPVDATP
jgi:hypothetical protein